MFSLYCSQRVSSVRGKSKYETDCSIKQWTGRGSSSASEQREKYKLSGSRHSLREREAKLSEKEKQDKCRMREPLLPHHHHHHHRHHHHHHLLLRSRHDRHSLGPYLRCDEQERERAWWAFLLTFSHLRCATFAHTMAIGAAHASLAHFLPLSLCIPCIFFHPLQLQTSQLYFFTACIITKVIMPPPLKTGALACLRALKTYRRMNLFELMRYSDKFEARQMLLHLHSHDRWMSRSLKSQEDMTACAMPM